MKRFLVVVLALLAGCSQPSPTTTHVDPPVGTSWAECPPTGSIGVATPFRANATDDAEGHAPGIARLDARTFLWVYANYTDTLREDRVTRLNQVDVAKAANGTIFVCTRVDLATPQEVDTKPRSYAVAVRLTAGSDLPPGPVRVVVNWIAGCGNCDPIPRGNTTAFFDART